MRGTGTASATCCAFASATTRPDRMALSTALLALLLSWIVYKAVPVLRSLLVLRYARVVRRTLLTHLLSSRRHAGFPATPFGIFGRLFQPSKLNYQSLSSWKAKFDCEQPALRCRADARDRRLRSAWEHGALPPFLLLPAAHPDSCGRWSNQDCRQSSRHVRETALGVQVSIRSESDGLDLGGRS